MRGYQVIGFPMRSPVVTAGGTDTITLDTLPSMLLGKVVHVAGFTFINKITPTRTAAPTVYGYNNLVTRMQVSNGMSLMFDGSYNTLRLHELLEHGALLNADPVVQASGSASHFVRHLSLGPSRFEGSPTDFIFPAAGMKNGYIQLAYGQLTDISADTTAYTGTIELIAHLVLLENEIRVPSLVERNSYAFGSTEYVIQGRALYASLGIMSGGLSTPTAITTGQIGNISIDTGVGALSTISSQAFTAIARMNIQNGSGVLFQAVGDPGTALDYQEKSVNATTQTAIQAADRIIQPVITSMAGQRISKMAFVSESGLRIRWSGALATGMLHATRIVAASDNTVAAIAGKACSELRMPAKSLKIKTLSKQDYNGARKEFMPSVVKL
jgi:hypothetical protein